MRLFLLPVGGVVWVDPVSALSLSALWSQVLPRGRMPCSVALTQWSSAEGDFAPKVTLGNVNRSQLWRLGVSY